MNFWSNKPDTDETVHALVANLIKNNDALRDWLSSLPGEDDL